MKEDPSAPKISVVWSAAGAIVLAMITAGAGLWGANIGARVTQDVTDRQLQEGRATKARELRADAYSEYLAAADTYMQWSQQLFANFKAQQQAQQAAGKEFAPDNEKAGIRDFWKAQSEYRAAANRVYVYGSDEAWQAHEAVAVELPATVGDYHLGPLDSAGYTRAYQGLQRIFCREAPPEPRAGC